MARRRGQQLVASVPDVPEGPLYCRALTPAEREAFIQDFPEFVAPMPPPRDDCPHGIALDSCGTCKRQVVRLMVVGARPR